MSANPYYWRTLLGMIGGEIGTLNGVPAGVPGRGDPCPPEVRIPLRALLRRAFAAGNRYAPIVDALLDVTGWDVECEDSVGPRLRVAIVVPVRGAHDALRLCVACLDAHTPQLRSAGDHWRSATIVLVGAEAEHYSTGLAVPRTARALTTPQPQSFAANVNLGASCSSSEFLVLLNSDAFVGPGWLDAILAPFADPDVVAVGPMGTNVSGHQRIGVTDANQIISENDPASVAQATRAFCEHAADVDGVRAITPYNARRLVGFCLAVRRSAWDAVGGMDEAFVNAYEDDALSLKLSLVGKCVVVPDLLVLHRGSASFAELTDAEANYRRTLVAGERVFRERYGWILPDWNAWMNELGWK